MKLYLAGNPGHGKAGKHRADLIKSKGKNAVISFFWCKEGGDFHKYFRRLIDDKDAFCRHRNNRPI